MAVRETFLRHASEMKRLSADRDSVWSVVREGLEGGDPGFEGADAGLEIGGVGGMSGRGCISNAKYRGLSTSLRFGRDDSFIVMHFGRDDVSPQGGFGAGAGQEVHPAGFAGAGLALHQEGQGGLTLGEAFEGSGGGGVVVEGEHALGAGAEFGGGLRAAQEQEAEERGLVAAKVEHVADAVLVLGGTAVGACLDEAEAFEVEECGADVGLGEFHHRLAAGLLVAGIDEGIEGEGIVLGRVDLFFDEAAEDAGFDGGEVHGDMVAERVRDRGVSDKLQLPKMPFSETEVLCCLTCCDRLPPSCLLRTYC